MACPEIAIPEIDAALHQRLIDQAIRAGASKDDEDRWHITTKLGEVVLTILHDPTSSTLHVTCWKRPYFVSCGMLAEKIQELIQEAKEAA